MGGKFIEISGSDDSTLSTYRGKLREAKWEVAENLCKLEIERLKWKRLLKRVMVKGGRGQSRGAQFRGIFSNGIFLNWEEEQNPTVSAVKCGLIWRVLKKTVEIATLDGHVFNTKGPT